METVPCLMHDGVCTIPDHAVTVREGRVAVLPRDEIVREFPDLDLERTNLRPLPFDGTHEELLAGARRLEHAGDVGERFEEGGGNAATMDLLSEHEAVAAAISEAQLTNALIVYCTPCGHQWVVDV
jgi:hypothetical protein